MSSHRLPDNRTPVLLSSDTAESLRREAAAILDYMERHAAVTPELVADMLFRTRTARAHRALAMPADRDELIGALRAITEGVPHPCVVAGTNAAVARQVAYVFPGQGSQRPGMGTLYYEQSPHFRAAVDECEAIFGAEFQISPLSYLLGTGYLDGTEEIVQPALFMQMIGLAAMWRAAGVEPAATIGHSQGEIAASCVAGIMSVADGVRLMAIRAALVGVSCRKHGYEGRYSMAVVGIDRGECEALLARQFGWAELSVINSAHILAIAGEQPVIDDVVAELNAEGKFAKEIRVAYPAHTSIVSGFNHEFSDLMAGKLDNPMFTDTPIPCFGATLGAAITSETPMIKYWFWNFRNRVRFDLAIEESAKYGIDTFIEIAEHPTLALAVMENLGSASVQRDFRVVATSRRTAEGLQDFTRNLATVAVHHSDYDWSALRAASAERPRQPLFDFPNTQMNERHLWATRLASPTAAPLSGPAAVSAPSEVSTFAPIRVRESWVRLPVRPLVPLRALTIVDRTRGNTTLVAELHAAAERQRMAVRVHGSGSNGAGIEGGQTTPAAVLVLVDAGADAQTDTAVTALADFASERDWLPGLDGIRDVWLVTVGGEQVLASDPVDLFAAAAQAGFRCLAGEYPAVKFRHLDLSAAGPHSASARDILAAIHTADEPELALRDGAVYVKRLIAEQAPDGRPVRGSDLGQVVITGGTGKLGLDLCEQFVRAGAARITLIGRSGGSAAALACVGKLRESGTTEIEVRVCDVRDETAVVDLAAKYRDNPVDLLVHATVDYLAAAGMGREAVVAAAAPKIVAADHLIRHLPRTPTGRVVLCSSLSSTIGGRGHLVYAAVNRMLDAAAARYRSEGVPCTSIQWGLWRDVGADQAEALAKISGTGLLPMDPAAATAAAMTAIADDIGNCIVAAADWARVADIFAIFGLGPLFSDLVVQSAVPTSSTTSDRAGGELDGVVDGLAVPNGAIADESDVVHAPDGPADAVPAASVPADGNVAERVQLALRVVMGMDQSESIDGSIPLVALGLDSLQALDLRKRVELELRRELPVAAILGGASLDEVVTLLE